MPLALATVWCSEPLSSPRRGFSPMGGTGSEGLPPRFELGKHDLNMTISLAPPGSVSSRV